MEVKRKGMSDVPAGALVPAAKKARTDVAVHTGKGKAPARTSSLPAPIMLLSGHEGDVFTAKFSPDGEMIASGGFERLIMLWSTYGECENFHTMKGHAGAIMQVKFSTDAERLYSASTDKTIGIWCMGTGERIKRLKGHSTFVNTVDCARRGPQIVCSGSDDGTVKVWDTRKKLPTTTLQSNYQVTAVCFNDTAEQVISGGIDNELKVWDLRKGEVAYKMKGHTDTVTGLTLSPDGSYVLSTAMDNTMRIWDVRPFAPTDRPDRCLKLFQGHQHTFEKNLLRCAWSPDGSRISSGSGDRFVYVWDTTTRRVVYKLPGHAGSVNDVDFHPVEPIIMSASSDKKIYLGEIEN